MLLQNAKHSKEKLRRIRSRAAPPPDGSARFATALGETAHVTLGIYSAYYWS